MRLPRKVLKLSEGRVANFMVPVVVIALVAMLGGYAYSRSGSSSSSTRSSSSPAPTTVPSFGGGQNMVLGLNINGLPGGTQVDMAGAVKYARGNLHFWSLQASMFTKAGMKVDDLLDGPYNNNGVIGIGDPTTWAKNALSWYQASGCDPALCPMAEILNEPGGYWFWGPNALSTANAAAYDNLLIAVSNAFWTAYGANHPKILASFDGGYANGSKWGQYMWQANPNIGNYIDGVTIHPYDPRSTGPGNEAAVVRGYSRAESLAGRSIPLYITEVGWQTTPSASETFGGVVPISNTVQLTTAQQCNNVYNFISWARGESHVNAVMFFDYEDDTSGDGTYGIEYLDGSHKPAYNALTAAAANEANPCS